MPGGLGRARERKRGPMLTNLFSLKELQTGEIKRLLEDAQAFRDGAAVPNFSGKIACNLFFEPSTRTQYSFQVAEEKLGLRVISFDPGSSSLAKKETFYDTVRVFDCFNVDLLVIRAHTRYYDELAGHMHTPIVSGGDGTGDHPSQSLLDLLTIRQEFGGFDGVKIAICGDIVHSRVAHTNYGVMQRMGMDVYVSGPQEYMEPGLRFMEFEQAVRECDILMMLRIQHERHEGQEGMTDAQYHTQYGLTAERVEQMKKGAIIMHPAPVNRGVEIADELVEHPRSRIFKQMENGVYVRMAAIRRSLEGELWR